MTTISSLSLFAQASKLAEKKSNKPTLVVGIVIDQMRYDYIYRFWDK